MAGVRPDKLTVSSIKSRLLNVSQSSLYRLTLSVPQAVRSRLSLGSYDYDNISLMCCEASLPGSSLTTHEVNNDYAGVTEKMAYRRMYDETIGLTFYVDREYKVIEMIEEWMNYITGISDARTYEDPYVTHRMAYPKSYKNNIHLSKFERDHFVRDYSANSINRVGRGRGGSVRTARTTLDYTFVQAFPLALTATPVSYEESSVLKCSVSFNFIRYVQKKRRSLFTTPSEIGGEGTRDLLVNRQPELVG